MFDTTHTKTIHVDVSITTNHLGEAWSMHDLSTDQDREIALTLPTGGMEQVANALFVESLRREAMIQVLKKATKEESFLDGWKGATREEQNQLLEGLTQPIREKILKQLEDVVFAALWDAMLDITR